MIRSLYIMWVAVFLGTGSSASAQAASSAPDTTSVQVYKSPTCGCCGKWITHLQAHGFTVTSLDMPDVTPIKDKLRVPPDLRSCHTALVGGYVFEGHVPADVIQKLLKEKPQVIGIGVPGMPIGSPGMEVDGRPADAYQVLAFDGQGQTTVYATR
jgi:hypothetical protein